MLFHRSSLPLSRRTLDHTAGVVRRHPAGIGSKGRALTPGTQALMMAGLPAQGETFAELGAGFGVSTTTPWRYVNQAVALLSARSPKLHRALRKATRDGLLYLVLDGTLIPIDRVVADRPFYCGKHRKHGMNLQAIATPDDTIVWVSGALPGSTHDLTAARIRGVLRALQAAGPLVLADTGYHGAGEPLLTPYRGKGKPEPQKDANRSHARLRKPGEHANAHLKTWQILRKLRCCPQRAGHLANAIHVLQTREAQAC
ncbi:IS5/IS1182 family transposase [Actinomadura darangshiensis]|uniref:IS5/IS1182 family transposase n=1 Tax=Actinomadura darangshiensis TaxID=705336 RepID=A0A4R4ZPR4_9ACTN|nr:transposase family protein [Actinomadura darangshiensis]TDD60903.1 IS5/IS1182 family transposase [Actinomadura darangshiensis]